MRRRLALAIGLALAGHTAAAAGFEPFAEIVVELRVNAQPQPRTLVVRRDTDGTLLLTAADLKQLRLRNPKRGAIQVNGQRYYRIGPDLGAQVVFDDATQSVSLEMPADAFVATRAAFASPDAPRVTPARPGGFVNYDVFTGHDGRGAQSGALFEGGLFGRAGVLVGSMALRQQGANVVGVRLDTTWTIDFPDRLATLRVGDGFTMTGAWGRSVRFGGVQFGTNFSTQPALVTTPLLQAAGEAVVPSTVDVFVNGRPVASEAVPPGPFTIEGLPAISGAGQLQLVVTDALGRQQVIAQPYYSSTALLRAGLDEYSFEFGAVRRDYGRRSNEYGDLAAAATWRRGLSDAFTAEVHAEGRAGGPRAAGLGAAWQGGDIGVLSASVAAGGDDAGSGWLGALGFERNGRRLSVYARGQYASESFAQLGSDSLSNRPRNLLFAGLGLNLSRYGNVQLAAGQQGYWNAPSVETVGLGWSLTLRNLGFLGLYATYAGADDVDSSVLFSWTMPLGERRSASSALRYSPGQPGDDFEAVASLQQNLGAGPGSGYTLGVSSNRNLDASYAYQGHAGVATVDYARRDGLDGWRAGAIGGLALTEAGVMPSRRLDRSFAVVQVADLPGIPVLLDNQPIGSTDSRGRLLVDGLRPYDRNAISIDATAVPLDAVLETDSVHVTPAYRSGGLFEFPVRRTRAATLRLRQADGRPVPAGARVTIGDETFPVALDGLLFVTGAERRRSVTARWNGGQCSFVIEAAGGKDPVPDLGTVACLAESAGNDQP